MKKTIRTIITLAIIATIVLSTVTLASAAEYDSTDLGYITLDTVVSPANSRRDYDITVGDLFWTGTIGSAESSGTLNYFNDGVTWTLMDGVLILKSHPVIGPANVSVDDNSPFWNNEHIETIVIDGNVNSIGPTCLSTFGLPNLKTVIFLSGTGFSVKGHIRPGESSASAGNSAGGAPSGNLGAFPTDHEINYVWEICHDFQGYASYLGYPSAVGTSIIGVDAWGGSGTPAEFLTKNQFFDKK